MSTLDDIQARADAATEGPWNEYYVPNIGGRPEDRQYGDWIIDSEKTLIASTGIWTERGEKDSVFIAHAREDVPKLVGALRAVEELCTTSEQHAEPYGDTPTIYVDTVRDFIKEALG